MAVLIIIASIIVLQGLHNTSIVLVSHCPYHVSFDMHTVSALGLNTLFSVCLISPALKSLHYPTMQGDE